MVIFTNAPYFAYEYGNPKDVFSKFVDRMDNILNGGLMPLGTVLQPDACGKIANTQKVNLL